MRYWIGFLSILFLLSGCGVGEKVDEPKDLVKIRDVILLESSLLGEHKHITVRTLDEEIIEIKVKWDHMPNIRVGKQISSLAYTKSDQSLYSISLN